MFHLCYTGDLKLRVGLHSGPVTAGVLQGEKSRFQLFGDTMNTASRMETTCSKNRIQCSVTTADLLIHAGREKWLKPRSELVEAKGKGQVQTYYISPRSAYDSNSFSNDQDDEERKSEINRLDAQLVVDLAGHMNKKQRLIDWHVELFSTQLKKIKASRMEKQTKYKKQRQPSLEFQHKEGSTAVDEVTEIIILPKAEFNKKQGKKIVDFDRVHLEEDVTGQLRDYITTIASMYNENSFHNFEHATHGTLY